MWATAAADTVTPADDTAELLRALRRGDRRSLDRLMPRVYDELHRMAHRELMKWEAGGTLQTTGLIHEAYLKLADQSHHDVADRRSCDHPFRVRWVAVQASTRGPNRLYPGIR